MQPDYDSPTSQPGSEAFRLFRLGRELVARQSYEKGAEQLRASLALDNSQAHAHSALSLALFGLNRLEEAEREASIALRMEPENPAYLSAKALLAQERKDWRVAQLLMKRAIAADPNDPDSYTMLCESLAAQRFFKDAEAAARQALALDAEHSTAHLLLGQLLERETLGPELFDAANRKRRREEAKWHRAQTLRLNPENQRAHFVAGQQELLDGNPERALEHTSTSLRLDPTDKEAQKVHARAQVCNVEFQFNKWVWEIVAGRLPPAARIPVSIVVVMGLVILWKLFPEDSILAKVFQFLGYVAILYILVAVKYRPS